mmetsp:Transcript_26068/g.57421  ORF Transcript_26068/g.57421 Transcript_26068/m.57421 type:complete len:447 (-) Transcript_26068:543-1883(-)
MGVKSNSIKEINFVIGNTYSSIPEEQAVRARSAHLLKIHDWQLYVDVVRGSPNLIHGVVFRLGSTFSPRDFTSRSPIPIKRVNGKVDWRFQTRQQSYGLTRATITILGSGGSRENFHYTIACRENGSRSRSKLFVDHGPARKIPIRNMPRGERFGIELELISNIDLMTIVRVLQEQPRMFASFCMESVSNDQSDIENGEGWRVVPGSSILLNESQQTEDCNRFRILSPHLTEDAGLGEMSHVISTLHTNLNAQANDETKLCVCIDVSDLSLRQLVKMCQNFVKFEEVLDLFTAEQSSPAGRQRGEDREAGSRFCQCQSNKQALGCHSNGERHLVLTKCETITALVRMMNPVVGWNYKLNLRNLVSDHRRSTIKFRQHPATTNHLSLTHWVRLCVAFVRNSALLAEPTPFRENRSLDFRFDALFFYVIKDRALREIYRKRKEGDEIS